jgi:hypothetical protein
MTGNPALSRQGLLNFAQFFSKGRGIVICGNVVVTATVRLRAACLGLFVGFVFSFWGGGQDAEESAELLQYHKDKGNRYLRRNKVCLSLLSLSLCRRSLLWWSVDSGVSVRGAVARGQAGRLQSDANLWPRPNGTQHPYARL